MLIKFLVKLYEMFCGLVAGHSVIYTYIHEQSNRNYVRSILESYTPQYVHTIITT